MQCMVLLVLTSYYNHRNSTHGKHVGTTIIQWVPGQNLIMHAPSPCYPLKPLQALQISFSFSYQKYIYIFGSRSRSIAIIGFSLHVKRSSGSDFIYWGRWGAQSQIVRALPVWTVSTSTTSLQKKSHLKYIIIDPRILESFPLKSTNSRNQIFKCFSPIFSCINYHYYFYSPWKVKGLYIS